MEILTFFSDRHHSRGARSPWRLTGTNWLLPALLIVTAGASLVWVGPMGYAQETASEYQIKAAYLFNFSKFVKWPDDAFADPLAPIVIGIVGDDPFGSDLPQVVLGKTVQGRDLVIKRYHTGDDLRGSHVLFISASEKRHLAEIISSLRGSSVLTVSDIPGFIDAGGMIEFFIENNRVRFAIGLDAARHARLRLSSKLLSVARLADGSPNRGTN